MDSDFTDKPYLAPLVPATAVGRARVAAAVGRVNQRIEDLADQLAIPLLDNHAFTGLWRRDELNVGGVALNLGGASAHPRDFFVDGLHDGTIVSGLYANVFLESINRAYQAEVPPLSDQELLQIGYLQQLCPQAELAPRVERLASHIAGLAPLAVTAMLQMCDAMAAGSLDQKQAQRWIDRCNASYDLKTGLAAAMEKQKPVFEGR